MTLKRKTNQKTRGLYTALVIVLVAALLGAGAYIAVDRFFIPYSAYQDALTLLDAGELDAAADRLTALDGFMDSAQALDRCNALRAAAALVSDDYAAAGGYYALINDKSIPEAVDVLTDAESKGDALFSRTLYERAYDCFTAFALPDKATHCVQTMYDSLTTDIENLCGVPAGFTAPMLRGYKDADKYALAYRIDTSDWSDEAVADENVRLIFDELGDFLDASAHGFTSQRLFEHRFSNSAGYYFMMDAFGDWVYNLPCYRLSGYYGLYTKIVDGVLYIGSDEKDSWTKQFRFTFSDYDQTLAVYSYRTGTTYMLYKEY